MKVAVVGDFMEDVYWIGEASAISAEVPIPVVKIKEIKTFPGGAGNVARNLSELGVNTYWFSGGGTPVKNRLMVGDHQVARWDQFDFCTPVMGLDRLKDVDAIVVADYGKGAITKDIIEKIKTLNIPTFVDTKGDPTKWFEIATAMFPNEKEYQEHLYKYDFFPGILVRKLGSKGLSLFGNSITVENGLKLAIDSPSQARFVRSVNGAGDTVIAAFVYKYLWILKDAKFTGKFTNDIWALILRFANTAASIAVENPFTYAPRLEQVQERYYEGS